MYIESLSIDKFRCFDHTEMRFQYPGRRHGPKPAPGLPNVNLLLGDNGTGKTAVLKAVALVVLAEIIQSTGFRPYYLVRRVGSDNDTDDGVNDVNAEIRANLRLHAEDTYPTPLPWNGEKNGTAIRMVAGQAVISRRRTIEKIESASGGNREAWEGLFVEDAPAFFLAGYGATRRVENAETFDTNARNRTRAPRYQRVAGLFEDYIGLVPVNAWIDQLMMSGRLTEGIEILNKVLPEDVRVNLISLGRREPQFLVRGTPLPFSALSDGYRAFIGWIGDLLFHLCRVIPGMLRPNYTDSAGAEIPHTNRYPLLTALHGVVMVDELDLLLHPAWQRTVVTTLAATFPRLQFFFTSHSPIIAGTLEAANIFVTERDPKTGATTILPGQESVHGLSADQILTSSYFDLPTPRAPDAVNQMNNLARRAWEGDSDASLEFLRRLTNGFEPAGSKQTGSAEGAAEE